MENSLKQRIVGAVVLIALAVIFLPSILKEKQNQQPFQSKIPPKPIQNIERTISEEAKSKNEQTQLSLDELESKTKERKSKVIKLADSDSKVVDKTESESEAKQLAKDKETQPTKIVPIKTEQMSNNELETDDPIATIGEQFKKAAWVIQIASFSNKSNAVSFVDKLKDAGHKAYRRKNLNPKGKTIYRIFVGPYIKKQGALDALIKVNKISSLSGIILAFDPIKH